MSKSDDPSTADDNHRPVEEYREIAQLAGALAHEIKNPLSTIRLNMELLAEDLAGSTNIRDRRALAKVAVVERECQRLENLLNDYLRYARLRHLRLEAVDLNAQIARLLDFFRPQAAEAGIEVVRFLDPDLPSVMLDSETFYSALLNLVLNAQQAMPDGGQLTMRTRLTPLGVGIDLIDTGCGMDERVASRIFEAFYSTKPGGSGLGLPTARKIIEAHGGRIHVLSAVGRGTQFTIELPTLPRLPVVNRENVQDQRALGPGA